jgi:hypothetical protein
MKIQPKPEFIAKVLDALPPDGSEISPRGVFVAIGGKSTPAYVRIVLRQLECAGRSIGAGPISARVYRRLQPQMEVA